MKKIIACLAMSAMVVLAHADNTTNYVMDGQFETPNGDVGPWGNMFGGDQITFLSTGGNPDGCVEISDAGSFGGIAYVNPPQQDLASLGVAAGQTYTFIMDMEIVDGSNIGGLKIESWTDTAIISDSGNMYPLSGSNGWATYTFTYRIANGATHLNIVPLWGPNSTVNYDNIGVIIQGVSPLTVAITSPTNSQTLSSNFTINATASVNPGSVTNVSFYIDNTLAGSATTAPYAYIATSVAAGAHALTAVATDNSGNHATSSVVDITVTNGVAAEFSAYESFNYTSIANGTPTTGAGFTGNWACGSTPTIVTGLTYPGLATANNALQSSSAYQLETLANAPSGVGTVWVSFLLSQNGDNGGNRDGFVVEDITGKGIMFAYQQFQATFGEPAIVTVSGHTAVGTQLGQSQTTRIYATNNLYVLKLTYAGGSLSSVSVYSDPTAGQGTAPTPDFTVSSGLSGIGVPNVIGLVHQAGIPLTLDEASLGSTFADVVGANLHPTVPTTLTLSVANGEQISWTAVATDYYQLQNSFDGVNYNNLGNVLYGTNVSSYYDPSPAPFYQVRQILPMPQEETINSGFETPDGFGGAGYWQSGGSEPPTYDTADAHTGSACVSLYITNMTAAGQTSDLQQNVVNSGGPIITGGASYTFSFWAKSQGKNPAGGYVERYKITWLDQNNATAGAVGFNDFAAGNGAWAQVNAGTFVAPTNAVDAIVEFFAATGGITNDYGGVLIDDVSLSGTTPSSTNSIIPDTIQNAAVFTAVINADGGTATAASGTIAFTTNGVTQSSITVTNGTASSTPAVAPNSYTLSASYLGDATYMPSSASMQIGGGVNTTPAAITLQTSGNQLTLSWPADHTGWTLQSQTNSLSTGLSTTWFDVPGSSLTNQVTVPIAPANSTVFYRMKF